MKSLRQFFDVIGFFITIVDTDMLVFTQRAIGEEMYMYEKVE